jgi:hypothetical protein
MQLSQNPRLLSAVLASFTTLTTLPAAQAATFDQDVAFLRKHAQVVVLGDRSGSARVAIVPSWQGRVMTSTADGESGASFGWINRELIASAKVQPHINVYGGEDRFWLGPEGGQFSIFFAKGAKFQLDDWSTPAPIDTQSYELTKHELTQATFKTAFSLTNYSGSRFDVGVKREVKLLTAHQGWSHLKVKPVSGVNLVAFESINTIRNTGRAAWSRDTGLLSVWILGMFNPAPRTTIVVPIKPGPDAQLGTKVTSDYFGSVPADRLVVRDNAIFFSADGRFRSKIGVNPRRSRAVLGSYDAGNKVLTIVQFTQPEAVTDYVNSLWKIQDNPYGGDALNGYNDGPPAPGARPLGPFYELESSSPAAALRPGSSLTHVHRTVHMTGDEPALDGVARAVLGVSLKEIESALPSH